MSNAMRFGKRSLAAVAAGALGLALVPMIGVTSAQAAVTAVTGSSPAVIAAAAAESSSFPSRMSLLTVTANDTLAISDTITVRLDAAPAVAGVTQKIQLSGSGNKVGAGAAATSTGAVTTAPTVTWPTDNDFLSVGQVAYLTNNSATARALTLLGTAPAAGTYSFTTWYNVVGDPTPGVLNPGEPYTAFSITVAGAPASIQVTPSSNTVGVAQEAYYDVTMKDAAGAFTFPTGGGQVNVLPSSTNVEVSGNQASSYGSTAILDVTDFISTRAGGAATVQGSAELYAKIPTVAGSYTINLTPGGTLPGTVTATAASITAQAVVPFSTSIVKSPVPGVSKTSPTYAAPTSVNAGTNQSLYAAVTSKTIEWTITASAATPGDRVAVEVADSGSAATAAGVPAGSSTVTLDANKQATFSVTAATPAAGDNYTVSFGQLGVGTGRTVYTVNFEAAALDISNLTTAPPLGSAAFVKTGEAQPIAATVTDQFGLPLQNITVTSVPSVSVAASAVTDAAGKATVTIPAPTTAATSQTVGFKVTAPLGTPSATSSTLSLVYNSSGGPTAVSATCSGGANTPAVCATFTQYVDVYNNTDGQGVWTASAGDVTRWMTVQATISPATINVPVTFSGTGLYFNPTTAAASQNLNSAATKSGTITALTNGSGVATVYVKATKTGLAKVSVVAGTVSSEIAWKVANTKANARVLEVSPATQDASRTAQIKATVTDAYGNPVANAPLNFSETGVGNFASGTSTLTTATGPDGSVTVDVISSTSGDSAVTVIAGETADYTAVANTPVTGTPAGKSSGAAAIKFGAGDRSITITGTRTTVSGKPGIKIDGAVTGIENGKTVVPYFRFPGETTFSQGSARPVIEGGKFTWQRKTGKKFYAYVTSDDGAVNSNRVIIAAN